MKIMHISKKVEKKIIQQLKKCEFKEFVDDNFDQEFLWEIKGSSVLSGFYNCKNTFMKNVIERILSKIKGVWVMEIRHHYVTSSTLIIEMTGSAQTIADSNYNNEYCWIMHFKDNKIVHLTAYYDSLLVNNTLL